MLFPMRTAKILKVIEENYRTKTFELDARPETENPEHKTGDRTLATEHWTQDSRRSARSVSNVLASRNRRTANGNC